MARRFLQALQASVPDSFNRYIDEDSDADGGDEATDGDCHNNQDKGGCFLLNLFIL